MLQQQSAASETAAVVLEPVETSDGHLDGHVEHLTLVRCLEKVDMYRHHLGCCQQLRYL